jgi:hypothetical protein
MGARGRRVPTIVFSSCGMIGTARDPDFLIGMDGQWSNLEATCARDLETLFEIGVMHASGVLRYDEPV